MGRLGPDSSDDLFNAGGYVTVKHNRYGRAIIPGTDVPVEGRVYPGVVKDTEPEVQPTPVEDTPVVSTEPILPSSVKTIVKTIAPEPPTILAEELGVLEANTALLRTAVGDIFYRLDGVDCSNKGFILLYVNSLKNSFVLKSGTYYWLAIRVAINGSHSGTFLSKVFYSGIVFNIPYAEGLQGIIFHVS